MKLVEKLSPNSQPGSKAGFLAIPGLVAEIDCCTRQDGKQCVSIKEIASSTSSSHRPKHAATAQSSEHSHYPIHLLAFCCRCQGHNLSEEFQEIPTAQQCCTIEFLCTCCLWSKRSCAGKTHLRHRRCYPSSTMAHRPSLVPNSPDLEIHRRNNSISKRAVCLQ